MDGVHVNKDKRIVWDQCLNSVLEPEIISGTKWFVVLFAYSAYIHATHLFCSGEDRLQIYSYFQWKKKRNAPFLANGLGLFIAIKQHKHSILTIEVALSGIVTYTVAQLSRAARCHRTLAAYKMLIESISSRSQWIVCCFTFVLFIFPFFFSSKFTFFILHHKLIRYYYLTKKQVHKF